MSDARAATDAVRDSVIDELQAMREKQTPGWRAMTVERAIDQMRADAARIRELEARQVPDGWQVVPMEPTRAMHDASNEVLGMPWRSVVPPGISHDDYVRQHEWAAMLAAAPRP